MQTPAITAHPDTSLFSLVTVVYSRELAMLRLQARSLARFAVDLGIGEILICVNDVDEVGVIARIREIVPHYGSLAPLVRIIGGEALLVEGSAGHGPLWRLRNLLTLGRLPLLPRRRGWRGHDGWQMQQAMKLMASRVAHCPYIIMLDAKNFLVAPVVAGDFLAEDGRPRIRNRKRHRLQAGWFPTSARVMRLANEATVTELLPIDTPACFPSELLRAVCAALEALNWPVAALFARPGNAATEFMLISAYCQLTEGSLDRFAEGGLRSYTIFAGHSADLAARILQEAFEENGKMIGLHARIRDNLPDRHWQLLCRIVTRQGLFDDSEEFYRFLDVKAPEASLSAAEATLSERPQP